MKLVPNIGSNSVGATLQNGICLRAESVFGVGVPHRTTQPVERDRAAAKALQMAATTRISATEAFFFYW